MSSLHHSTAVSKPLPVYKLAYICKQLIFWNLSSKSQKVRLTKVKETVRSRTYRNHRQSPRLKKHSFWKMVILLDDFKVMGSSLQMVGAATEKTLRKMTIFSDVLQ